MAKRGRDPETLRSLAKEMDAKSRRASRNEASLTKWAREGLDVRDAELCRRDAARYEGEARFAFQLAASLRRRAARSEHAR